MQLSRTTSRSRTVFSTGLAGGYLAQIRQRRHHDDRDRSQLRLLRHFDGDRVAARIGNYNQNSSLPTPDSRVHRVEGPVADGVAAEDDGGRASRACCIERRQGLGDTGAGTGRCLFKLHAQRDRRGRPRVPPAARSDLTSKLVVLGKTRDAAGRAGNIFCRRRSGADPIIPTR